MAWAGLAAVALGALAAVEASLATGALGGLAVAVGEGAVGAWVAVAARAVQATA